MYQLNFVPRYQPILHREYINPEIVEYEEIVEPTVEEEIIEEEEDIVEEEEYIENVIEQKEDEIEEVVEDVIIEEAVEEEVEDLMIEDEVEAIIEEEIVEDILAEEDVKQENTVVEEIIEEDNVISSKLQFVLNNIQNDLNILKWSCNTSLEIQNQLMIELKNVRYEQNIIRSELLNFSMKYSDDIININKEINECNKNMIISEEKIRRSFKTQFENMGRFQEQIRDEFLEKVKNGEFGSASGRSLSNYSSGSSKSWEDYFKFFFDIGSTIISTGIDSEQRRRDGTYVPGSGLSNIIKKVTEHEFVQTIPEASSFLNSPSYKAFESILDNTTTSSRPLIEFHPE